MTTSLTSNPTAAEVSAVRTLATRGSSKDLDRFALIDVAAKELLTKSPDLAALARTDANGAYDLACDRADRALRIKDSDRSANESADDDMDAQLDRRAKALMESDPEIKALAAKDWSDAFDLACDRVAKEINYRAASRRNAST